MLQSLPDFLSAYWIYLAGVVVLCALLGYFSDKFRANLKKGLIIFGVIFALVAGYELVTGNNIVNLPGSVNKKLSESPKNAEKGYNYYNKDRWGDAMPDNK